MQAPGGPEEDVDGGFAEGGWSVGYWDEVVEQAMARETSEPFESLLGRKTYEIFAAHWPQVEDEDSGADTFNNARKYVVSTTLDTVDWQNSVLLQGDLEEELQKLKATDGPDLQVAGSSQLIQALLRYDLVDELWLKIYPVILGKGKRLFGEGAIPMGLKLVESHHSPSGIIIATYMRDGAIKKGSFALD